MPSENEIKIPLHQLIEILRGEGFEISNRTILDVQKILANLDDVAKKDTANLKYLLAPLVCRNKEEQDKFYRVFDNYESGLNTYSKDILDKADNDKKAEEERKIIAEQNRKKRIKWIKIIAFSVLIIAAGCWAYLYFDKLKPKETRPYLSVSAEIKRKDSSFITNLPSVNTPYDGSVEILKDDAVIFSAKLGDTIKGSNYTVDWKLNNSNVTNVRTINQVFAASDTNQLTAYLLEGNKRIDSFISTIPVLCEHRPIFSIENAGHTADNELEYTFRAKTDDEKQLRNYQYEWYIDDQPKEGDSVMKNSVPRMRAYTVKLVAYKGKTKFCDEYSITVIKNELPELELAAVGTAPLVLQKEWNDTFLKYLFWTLLFGGLLIYNLFYEERLKKILKQFFGNNEEESTTRKGKGTYTGPFTIAFNSQETKIHTEPAILQLAETLRKRHETDVYRLHIGKTIRSTIKKGGFPDFQFTPVTQPVDYLVFIDKEYPSSHIVKLYNYVVSSLAKEQVNLTVYNYHREPLLLSNEKLNHQLIPVDKLSRLYPGTILFLFADAETFFRPHSRQLYDWVKDKFKNWQTKIIFTAISEKDWGEREKVLYDAGFTVVPADINGHNIISSEINNMIDKHKLKKSIQPGAYSYRLVNFNTWGNVEKYIEDACAENKITLGIQTDPYLLKEWLCATAVYPHINWDVSIAIGKAIEDVYAEPGKLVNYSNLLILSRISWLKDGQMPDKLRVEMLQKLSKANEIIARETVSEMLGEISDKIPASSLVFGEYKMQQVTNRFLVNKFRKGDIDFKDPDFTAVKEYLDKDKFDLPTDTYLNSPGGNTLIQDPKNSTSCIPLRDYVEQKHKEGSLKELIIRRAFNRQKLWLILKTTGLIAALFGLITGALIFLLNINPRILPAKADRLLNIADGSLIELGSDSISFFQNNNRIETERVNDSVMRIKDMPTATDSIVQVTLETNNTVTGNQILTATVPSGFEKYDLALIDPESKPVLLVRYNREIDYRTFKNELSFRLSKYRLNEVQNTATSDSVHRLVYFDTSKKDSADAIANSLRDILGDIKVEYSLEPGSGMVLYLNFRDTLNKIPPPCSEVNLPRGLIEIWSGGSAFRLINLQLDKKLIYYSTGDKSTFGAYRIQEVCITDKDVYRVITSAENKYKIFFIKDINSSSGFSLSVCQNLYNTIEDARKVEEANCDRYNSMRLYYESDPNRIYLPIELNILEKNNLAKLNRIKDSLTYSRRTNNLAKLDGLLHITSRYITFDWELPDSMPSDSYRQTRLSPETPFDRPYMEYKIVVPPPPCNTTFNSLNEALSVSPDKVCRLILRAQQLKSIPAGFNKFSNLIYLDIRENFLNPKDSIALKQMFPYATILFSKQLKVDDWKLLKTILLNPNNTPRNTESEFFKMLTNELRTNAKAEIKIVVNSTNSREIKAITDDMRKYLASEGFGNYISNRRIIFESPGNAIDLTPTYSLIFNQQMNSVTFYGRNLTTSFMLYVDPKRQAN